MVIFHLLILCFISMILEASQIFGLMIRLKRLAYSRICWGRRRWRWIGLRRSFKIWVSVIFLISWSRSCIREVKGKMIVRGIKREYLIRIRLLGVNCLWNNLIFRSCWWLIWISFNIYLLMKFKITGNRWNYFLNVR